MGYIGEGINQTRTSVETSKEEFFGTYYGQAATDPTVDPNGNPITDGDLFYNTTQDALKIRVNGQWLSLRTATTGYQEFTATADQTTFNVSGSYTPGFVFVTLNGVVLSDADYDDSDGTTIVLTEGANADDILGLYLFDTFSVADTVSASNGGTFSGAVTFSDSATLSGSVSGALIEGFFRKSDHGAVAWTKTGNGTAELQVDLTVEVNGTLLTISSGTSISMPTLTAGTDYAIWVAPDGSLEADTSFTTAPTANGRLIGGFHYAPGGNATFGLDEGDGGTTAQINKYSFWDLKWRPSVIDPRGLTLVGDGAFWAGIYLMSANHLTGPVHKYGVDPCRDGNPPALPDGSGNYPNAEPSNIFEALAYHGFRAPDYNEFQLLAYGTNEDRSIGGSGPGNTGDVSDRSKDQQTSAWGVFDSTGVLRVWGRDHTLAGSYQPVPNPSRGSRFRFDRFAHFGGNWDDGSESGSRSVFSSNAIFSSSSSGGRGVCDHLILD